MFGPLGRAWGVCGRAVVPGRGRSTTNDEFHEARATAMGLKTNIALGLLATGGLVLGGGSAAFLIMQNQKAAEVTDDLDAYNLASVAGYTPAQGDETLELLHQLSGGNTMLAWDAEKNKPGGAHDAFSGTWTNLTGAVVYNPVDQTLNALEVIIQTNSIVGLQGTFQPAPPTLTNTLIGETPGMPAWFDLESNPTAHYTATEFITREQAEQDGAAIFDNAPEGWTHLIQGTFTLNGKDVPLNIPAKAEFIGDELVLDLAFQLNRSDFGVDGTIVGGWVVDDIIALTATVESAPKGDIIVDTLRDHDVRLAENRALIDAMGRMENQIEELNSQVAAMREQLASGAVAGGPSAVDYDLSELPEAFTETIQYPGKQPMGFNMVRVPGDADAGIAPFYMAEHEVTWELFYDWSYRTDIDVNTAATLENQDLRPSTLYGDSDQLKIGLDSRPAISMSRRTAEAFCKWLSEQTGRNYRLPTDAEWLLALELGGGIPSDRDALMRQATMLDNAESKAAEAPDQFDPFADDSAEEEAPLVFTTIVGSREPNALGIYDMIGNAAEWVTGTGADRYVRGGHFRLAVDEFSGDWKAVEDQDIWNRTYPQKPNSRFWYRDHYYQGIRLVCDPVNIPQ
ncbi:SUMF1/EgtB/PvdO family nonheme iron enzyme [Phycisphaeraceae bacterium D3-23]